MSNVRKPSTFKEVKSNVLKILECQPDREVDITKLELVYSMLFDRQLEWEVLGFDSSLDLLDSMKDVLTIKNGIISMIDQNEQQTQQKQHLQQLQQQQLQQQQLQQQQPRQLQPQQQPQQLQKPQQFQPQQQDQRQLQQPQHQLQQQQHLHHQQQPPQQHPQQLQYLNQLQPQQLSQQRQTAATTTTTYNRAPQTLPPTQLITNILTTTPLTTTTTMTSQPTPTKTTRSPQHNFRSNRIYYNNNYDNRPQMDTSIYNSTHWLLKVDGFPVDTEEGELKELFNEFGCLRVVIKRTQPFPFALVEIPDYEQACEAFLRLDLQDFMCGKLNVQFDRNSIARNQSMDRSGGRGRGQERGQGQGQRRGRRGDGREIHDGYINEERWPPRGAYNRNNYNNNNRRNYSNNYRNNNNNRNPRFPNQGYRGANQEYESPLNKTLKKLCMDRKTIERMFKETSIPNFTNFNDLPKDLELVVLEEITDHFFWAAIINEDKNFRDMFQDFQIALEELKFDDLPNLLQNDKRSCSLYQETLCRAWIINENADSQMVDILYIDYGTKEVILKQDLKRLPDKFWNIPPLVLPFYTTDKKDHLKVNNIFKAKLISTYKEYQNLEHILTININPETKE